VADLKAQVAANEKGAQELRKMVAHFGLDVVQAYMGHVQDNAEESVRAGDRSAEGLRIRVPDRPGAVIKVKITVDRTSARQRSISPAPRREGRTTSTRPNRSPAPRCSIASA
jgi:5-oxoprolinase (ATP-hydrolysing)